MDKFDDVENIEEMVDFLLQEPEPSNSEEKYFAPAEFVWMVDQFFTQIGNRKLGFFMGVLYTFVTYGFAITIWFGIAFVLTFTEFFTSGINLALISITIGSFVILTGSNLVNHFDEENLNFRAYVHNSVTFIGSGIALLSGYIFRIIVENRQVPTIFDFILSGITFGLNFIGGFLLMVSLWVVLKLLWRLDQLTAWKKDYDHTKTIYSEFRASIAGLKAGYKAGTDPSEIGILGSIIGTVISLGILAIPYVLTREIFWSVVFFTVMSGLRILGMIIRDKIPQMSRYQKVQSLILAIIFIVLPYYLERNTFLSSVVLSVFIISYGIRFIKSR